MISKKQGMDESHATNSVRVAENAETIMSDDDFDPTPAPYVRRTNQ